MSREVMTDINPDDDEDRMYDTAYIAELFNVTTETVRNWIDSGRLKGRKINGRHMVRRRDLIAFANSKYTA